MRCSYRRYTGWPSQVGEGMGGSPWLGLAGAQDATVPGYELGGRIQASAARPEAKDSDRGIKARMRGCVRSLSHKLWIVTSQSTTGAKPHGIEPQRL